ncbi:MAG: RNA polymerase sigma factor [Verrucomicrobiota bacterium]
MDEDVPTLTRRMAAGDEAAYRSFFAEYFPRMCTYGSKLTSGNEALAQDLVQDTLLRVVRNIKPMDSADELWCWLVLLLRCSFIDAVRKHKRYSSLLESYALNLELGSAPTKISLSNSEALYRALQRLRKEERKLLLAKYYDDSSYSEIASVLGISEKAIESRLGRLRRKMKTYLRGADL